MAWPVAFSALGGGNQPLTDFDTMFAQVAAMVAIPCVATGTNSVALAPIGNAPSSANLGSYSNFNTFSFIASATSTGPLSAQFGSLASLPIYRSDGTTQATTGDFVTGRPYTLMYAASLNSGGGGFYLLRPALQPSGGQATQQVLLTGSSATYTTPANCLQLRIRMCGGGGGGSSIAASGSPGGAGGATTFNAVTANPGTGAGIGLNSTGSGGTGGAGAATLRSPGIAGQGAMTGPGGGGFGGGGSIGSFGAGGQGQAIGGAGISGNGGGSAEYVELVINNPAATYTYTVGVAGNAGAPGAGGFAGIIIVEERYQTG